MAYRPPRTKLLAQHTYSVPPLQSFELRRVDTQDHKPNSTHAASAPGGPVRPPRTLFLGGNGCRGRSCCRGRLGILGVEVINRLQNRLRLLVHVGEQGFDMVERWEREEEEGLGGFHEEAAEASEAEGHLLKAIHQVVGICTLRQPGGYDLVRHGGQLTIV